MTKKSTETNEQKTWRQFFRADLFLFNILILVPFVLVILDLAKKGSGASGTLGHFLVLLFLAPMAITVVFVDLYRVFGKK